MDRIFKAHIKGTSEEYQTLQKHSTKTADLCEAFSRRAEHSAHCRLGMRWRKTDWPPGFPVPKFIGMITI